jgi:hypothetical protein
MAAFSMSDKPQSNDAVGTVGLFRFRLQLSYPDHIPLLIKKKHQQSSAYSRKPRRDYSQPLRLEGTWTTVDEGGGKHDIGASNDNTC